MVILNTLNGGRIYKGSAAEIEALIFPGDLTYEEYSSTTVYFYTTDSGSTIQKNVSDQVIIGDYVLFHFNQSELDVLEDGVIYYFVDYGTVQREFNTSWYLATPKGYASPEYATEEYVDTAINNAITGISAVTIDEVDGMISSALTPYYTSAETTTAINNATSGLTKKTSFTAHTADTSIHFTMSDVETDISGYLRRNNFAQMSDVNDAVGAAVEQIEYELGSYVKSDTCHTIWTGTQSAYDSMSAHSADVLYIVKD